MFIANTNRKGRYYREGSLALRKRSVCLKGIGGCLGDMLYTQQTSRFKF